MQRMKDREPDRPEQRGTKQELRGGQKPGKPDSVDDRLAQFDGFQLRGGAHLRESLAG